MTPIAFCAPRTDVRNGLRTLATSHCLTGTVLDDSDFYPFGAERPIQSSSGNTYKFTGKERDTESGLDNFGARYYSSSLGRFISSDWSSVPVPVPYANLTNPQTLNLYAIVHDNPETFADLDGHDDAMLQAGTNGSHENPTAAKDAAAEEKSDAATAQQQADEQAKQQQSDPQKPAPQPPSWDKTKPLPDDPSKLGPDWKKNPEYKNPYGEEYINVKTGEKLEWNKGPPGPWGPKADRGKDGWHYTPPGGVRGKQLDPGQVLKTAAKVGFWGTVAVVTIRIVQAVVQACAEGACY